MGHRLYAFYLGWIHRQTARQTDRNVYQAGRKRCIFLAVAYLGAVVGFDKRRGVADGEVLPAACIKWRFGHTTIGCLIMSIRSWKPRNHLCSLRDGDDLGYPLWHITVFSFSFPRALYT